MLQPHRLLNPTIPSRFKPSPKSPTGASQNSALDPKPALKVQSTCVLAVDGAPAWGKAAESLGLGTLKGVRHNAKIFTPTSRLQKSSLKPSLKAVLHKKAQAKTSCVKETQKDFVLPGGDNAAEGLFGHLKTALRRVQNIGRGGGEATRTVQALAGAALVRRPGYQAILDAHSAYRRALITGVVQLSPSDAYDASKCQWLYTA